jgi:thioredoxin-related protein
MTMKPKILIVQFLLLLSLPLFSNNEEDTSIKVYTQNSFDEARKEAFVKGKELVVYFHTTWCEPCQWMEVNTFVNERLTSMLSKDYVMAKIDIDQLEGFELRSRYEIRFMPTILIFTPEGKLIERVEKTLSAEMFMDILGKINHTSADQIRHGVNLSPKERDTQGTVLSKKENTETYRLQAGVFSKYDGAEALATKIQSSLAEKVVISRDEVNGKTMFRVLIGHYTNKDQASQIQRRIKDLFNIETVLFTPRD